MPLVALRAILARSPGASHDKESKTNNLWCVQIHARESIYYIPSGNLTSQWQWSLYTWFINTHYPINKWPVFHHHSYMCLFFTQGCIYIYYIWLFIHILQTYYTYYRPHVSALYYPLIIRCFHPTSIQQTALPSCAMSGLPNQWVMGLGYPSIHTPLVGEAMTAR